MLTESSQITFEHWEAHSEHSPLHSLTLDDTRSEEIIDQFSIR
jgi:hypothetical protein